MAATGTNEDLDSNHDALARCCLFLLYRTELIDDDRLISNHFSCIDRSSTMEQIFEQNLMQATQAVEEQVRDRETKETGRDGLNSS